MNSDDQERFDITSQPDWFATADVNYLYEDAPDPGGFFDVKTSGDQEEWDTGAVRDSQNGKLRYDLISPVLLGRLAYRMTVYANYYGEHNWTKGIPSSRYMASLMRHVEQHRAGERDDDHLAAAVFNIMGLMQNEGTDLDDLFQW